MQTITMLMWRGALVGAALLVLSGPAVASDLYRWVTHDGTISFTDEVKRVPETYRRHAHRGPLTSLAGYARFTPADAKAQADYAEDLDTRLDRLRAINSEPVAPEAERISVSSRVHPLSSIELRSEQRVSERRRVGHDRHGRPVYRRTLRTRIVDEVVPTVQLPVDPDSSAPIVSERLRVFDGDTGVTRHVTVVRQGERVLGVIKPRVHGGPIHWGYEEDLER